ncbi:cornifelin-like protein b isoform X1 [Ictalurus punctatus]|uniref:Cornifelin-like protein b n=1 Tax=Ictalurus punctatus TaxID=7998 RepID=E3TGE6_ICTPU|nr:cornifelin-like protein b [Ictalurus punctatus]XP_017326482.1 cornifelin-like protein b isoform X1 [Ictalurus punctatus]ADO29382.1 cornifelin-like protein b [Ictalurus punctatus]
MAKMVVQQPQPVMMANTSYSNQWSSGIFDCCENVAECCFSFWCFPCFACSTSRKFGECLCLPMLDGYGLIPPITLAMRASMRQRYGIEGSICNDCIYSFFCLTCVWCQMSREMKARNHSVTLINSHTR